MTFFDKYNNSVIEATLFNTGVYSSPQYVCPSYAQVRSLI